MEIFMIWLIFDKRYQSIFHNFSSGTDFDVLNVIFSTFLFIEKNALILRPSVRRKINSRNFFSRTADIEI